MYRLKKTAAMITIAAMMLSQSVTALAAGPGEGISSSNTESSNTGVNTGNSNVYTANTPLANQSTGTTSSKAPGSTTTNTGLPGSVTTAASTGAIVTSSKKILPTVALDVEAIRPTFVLPGEGAVEPDPVLSLVPLATYYVYDAAGNRVDYGYTHDNSFVFAPTGFSSLKLEHQNVGRYYYRTYSQASGWGPWATSKEQTPNQGVVQAVQFRAKGYTHNLAEVYYRAVLNDGTETDWAQAGQACGTIGTDKYIVALKVALWKQGVNFPLSIEKPLDNAYTEGVYYDGNGAQYSTADGHAYTGWGYDKDSNRFYFENGQRVTGWHVVNGYNLYFDGEGKALTDYSSVMAAPGSYAIRINKATRTLYVLAKDDSGNFTIPYKTIMITTGTDTPLGSFKIYEKYRWHFMHTDCYCQFLCRFYQGFLMHSLLYTRPDMHTFDAINYNFMDDAISGGCIRMRAVDCAWVYNNCGYGTTVTIYEDMWDKGPVEKDAIEQAIPRSQDYDPTDPVITAAQDAAQKAEAEKAEAEALEAAAAGIGEPG